MDLVRRPILALTLVALVACGSSTARGHATISTSDGSIRVPVEIADTDAERAKGLSGRDRLAPDDGMAFVFEQPSTSAFWMKDTTIPLSIAFWDSAGRIVGIMDMPPCRSDPCRLYRPDRPYVGALEVNRGFFDAHGVTEGDQLVLDT